MITKRIIPCLDVKNGRVVKGVNFEGLVDVSSPTGLAEYYSENGADELVFYDITASFEGRELFTDILTKVARRIFIPLTVGGGIRTVDDFKALLREGADKIAINSSAINRPELISEAADKFGSQCVVLAVDAKSNGRGGWNVYKHGGRIDTGIDVLEWVVRAEKLGAGEILLTSMDRDGTKEGFDVPLTKAVSSLVNIPVIASGGAGKKQDFAEILEDGGADAALAASLFHFGQLGIKELKNYLSERGIPVRGGYHG